MKFGFRVPSFKKRVSARTSWKRVARHSLGLKAPRGWGVLTNPKKAAYNRVYNRTTVDVFRRNGRGRGGSAGGCGSLLVGLAVLGLFTKLSTVVWSLAVSALSVCAVILIFRVHGTRKQNAERLRLEAEVLDRAATEARLEQERALVEEEGRKQRYASLEGRFGIEVAQRIWKHEYWEGATAEMIVESLGQPVEIKERLLKTKTKTTYCYRPTSAKRYALRIHFENLVVMGWDER